MFSPRDPQTPVITKSFGCAVFLHGLGHPITRVESPDGTAYNARYHFPASARPDLDRFYRARDSVNASILRYIQPRSNPTYPEPHHEGQEK